MRIALLVVPALVAALLASAVLTERACAQNWPSFRGPNGSGVGTGDPPVSWDVESGKNVRWRVAIPGLAHSSPIVWGEKVFVTTAVPVEGRATFETGWLGGTGESAPDEGPWRWQVMCLDRSTGKTVWVRTAYEGVPRSRRHRKATFANGSPATDGKHLAAFFGSEGLYLYDLDGNLLWKKDLGVLKSGPASMPDYEWGYAGSPILHDGQVIVQCDLQDASYWASFDAASGKEIRRVERGDDPTWTTPTVVSDSKGQAILVCNGYKTMAGYELATGKRRWHLAGGGDVPVPRPVPVPGGVILTNGHGRMRPIYVIGVDAEGDLTPTKQNKPDGIRWWNDRRGSYMPTPIVVGEGVFVADDMGVLTRFALADGTQSYRERLPAPKGSTYSASAVSAAGRLYVTSESGRIDIVSAGETFESLGSNEMNETCMATPAISDGFLFVRGAEHLFCLTR